MENELRENLIMIFIGWFLSGGICIITLTIYWFGFSINGWNFELTLLAIVDFGILGFLIVLTSIITFLCRFKIVRR